MTPTKQKQHHFLTSIASLRKSRPALLIMLSAIVIGAGLLTPYVRADQFDDQINALNGQNAVAQSSLDTLLSQASSYQDAINQLQSQINAVQAAIAANQAQQADLQAQIIQQQQEIDKQKAILGNDIKTSYVSGQLTPVEALATSSNLSDYIDKQEAYALVQDTIQKTMAQIQTLQHSLQVKKAEVDQLLADENAQNDQLGASQAKQNELLAYNQGQQDTFNSQISANSSKIADLRRQQILANSRFSAGAVGSGPTCGGGYPARWCEVAQDSVFDSWGMYNRECVSYTAFKVAASGRYMPAFGWASRGNANQWPAAATDAGIPEDGNPRAGDVAISMRGFYGHAMYVDSVNSDGSINISQYNVNLDGRYSTNTVNPSGLIFIHF
jgi:surface antigen